MRRWLAAALLPLLAGCADPVVPPCTASAATGPIVWVVDHGWHTDIGLPADELAGPLAYYRGAFPGAQTLMFGFGKRTFMTAKVETAGELLLGPVPGPGAIQVTALRGTPAQAYGGTVILLALPPGGVDKLSAFLWGAIEPSQLGGPRLISEGLFPGSAFYASTRGYNLTYTCNTWTVDGLRHAGLAVDGDVILAGGVMRQVARVKGACRTSPS